jgi:hypothetical protein
MRFLGTLLFVLFALTLASARAQDADTPKPTAPPPPGSATLIVRVIDDSNGNGRVDSGEVGLEGWHVSEGCGKLFTNFGITNGSGVFINNAMEPGQTRCFTLEVQDEWIPTSSTSVYVDFSAGETSEITFFVWHVRLDSQFAYGVVIRNGLPAVGQPVVQAVVDGAVCGDATATEYGIWTRYQLYVLGEAARAGCATDGGDVVLTVDGVEAKRFLFEPGADIAADLVIGPEPMYFSVFGLGNQPIPYVGGKPCGESRRWTGPLSPEEYYMVYVLPDAIAPGCGAAGRTVVVKSGSLIVMQVPWQAGQLLPDDLPPFTPIPDAILPNSGQRASGESDYPPALLLGAIGVALGAVGLLLKRRIVG